MGLKVFGFALLFVVCARAQYLASQPRSAGLPYQRQALRTIHGVPRPVPKPFKVQELKPTEPPTEAPTEPATEPITEPQIIEEPTTQPLRRPVYPNLRPIIPPRPIARPNVVRPLPQRVPTTPITQKPIVEPIPVPQPIEPELRPIPVPQPIQPEPRPIPVPRPIQPEPRPIPVPRPIQPEPRPIPVPRPIQPELRPSAVPRPIKPDNAKSPLLPSPIISDYVCSEANQYYSRNLDCESYIECKKHVAYSQRCPDGLHFNRDAIYPEFPCGYPLDVKCGNLSYTEKVDPAQGCPHQYGFFALRDGDCSRYVMCHEGVSFVMNCPAGLVFNSEKSSCDWPENVPACNPTIFQGFSCPEPAIDEYGQPIDSIYKYRYGQSCKNYVACSRGHPRLLSCDAGLYFDAESETCVDSDYVTDCVN